MSFRAHSLILLILISGFFCKDRGQTPPKDYLSPAWAVFMSRFPSGTTDANAGNKQAAIQKASELNRQAYALYLNKKDKEAIQLYEDALSNFATGEIYYNYANSLSNVELEKAVKAYQIALDLHYAHPELAFYNIACAYARLGELEKAFGYMALAINRGYNAFEHIKKDPDLAALRQVEDWENKIKGLVPADIEFGPESLTGMISRPGPRGPTLIRLCPNGVFWTSYGAWATTRGKWHLRKGDLYMTTELDCSLTDPEGHYRGSGGGGGDTFEGCRAANGENFLALEKTTIARMLSGEKSDSYMAISRTPMIDSRYCEASWRPASAADVAAIGSN